jgi:hypothetical protein
MSLSNRVDVVAQTENPRAILAAVFGRPYSRKRAWPEEVR